MEKKIYTKEYNNVLKPKGIIHNLNSPQGQVQCTVDVTSSTLLCCEPRHMGKSLLMSLDLKMTGFLPGCLSLCSVDIDCETWKTYKGASLPGPHTDHGFHKSLP